VQRNQLSGFAVSEYRDQIATCINAFKERGHRNFAKLFAKLIAAQLTKPAATLILPAPSLGDRGFVPAEQIAYALGRIWQLPVARLMLRPGGGDQSELKRIDRIANLNHRIWSPTPLHGKRVLLLDDVVTTGATIGEMARAVAEAGGVVATFITVAETMPKSHTKFQKKV